MEDNNQASSPASTTEGKPIRCKTAVARNGGYSSYPTRMWGADYCFECVGTASVVHEAYAPCRKGWVGEKTIVLGVDKLGACINLSSHEVLHEGKSLMLSLFGGLKPKSHVLILRKRYEDKELQLEEFFTHEAKFNDI